MTRRSWGGPYTGWWGFRWGTSPGDPDPRVLIGTDPHGQERSVGEVVAGAWRDRWYAELADPSCGGRRYLARQDCATPTIGRGMLERWVIAEGGQISARAITAPVTPPPRRRLSSAALEVLAVLGERPATVAELAATVGRAARSVRLILGGLHERGLVRPAGLGERPAGRGRAPVLWRAA